MDQEGKSWIIVASRDHVKIAVKEGFCQANHGKAGNLKRMQKGDGVIFYSSKEIFGEPEPYQKFTAIGRVNDDEVYVGHMAGGFEPYRRKVKFYTSKEVEIKPLIDELSFIENKKRWGFIFRLGLFEIANPDFGLISKKMRGL